MGGSNQVEIVVRCPAIPAVVNSEAGWLNGKAGLLVGYRPEVEQAELSYPRE